jgi:hypothetical protein
MITGAEIGLGIQALRTAFNLAKEAKELTDTTAIRAKVIEMQTLIMEAQSNAIDAREAHSHLVAQIRDLEQEIHRLKAWDNEKQKYELQSINGGSVAYALRADIADRGAPHWLCGNCFERGQKSFLQAGAVGAVSQMVTWSCAVCSSKIMTSRDVVPK